MTDHYRACADKMSGPGRKRAACSDDDPPPKKRGVSAKTVGEWITENNKALSTSTWLKYDKADREYVARLKCSVCIEFQDKLYMRYAQLQQCIYWWIEEPVSF